MHNPSGMPDVTWIDDIYEPFIAAQVISKSDYQGAIMKLCLEKRGTLRNQVYLTQDRVELSFDLPKSIKSHANNDQNRSAPNIERHIQCVF